MMRLSRFEVSLLALIAVGQTASVLVARWTRISAPNAERFSVVHLMIVSECLKFVLAAFLEEKYSPWGLKISLKSHVVHQPRDALKMFIPAILCFYQTSLLYVAISNIPVPAFQVIYQSKLAMTALLSVVILGRQYSRQQWMCLVTLVAGSTLTVLGNDYDFVYNTIGISAAFLAGLLYSFACVYFEMLLKHSGTHRAGSDSFVNDEEEDVGEGSRETLALTNDPSQPTTSDKNTGIIGGEMPDQENTTQEDNHVRPPMGNQRFVNLVWTRAQRSVKKTWIKFMRLIDPPRNQAETSEGLYRRLENLEETASLWMRCMQLAFFSIIIAVLHDMYEDTFNPPPGDYRSPFFHGFTFWVWVLAVLQGVSGLAVAAVIKYADNVLKGMATSVSVLLSTWLSWMFFGTKLSWTFLSGAVLVLVSVVLFSAHIRFVPGSFTPHLVGREAVRRYGNSSQQDSAENSLTSPLLVV